MTDQSQSAPPPPGDSPRNPTFEERMERFGQEVGEAGERIGRQAEDAGKRLAANPGVVQAADTAARVWGLVLIVVGLWFLAEFTLGYDLPAIPWRDIWPLGIILIGLVVIARGLGRRSA